MSEDWNLQVSYKLPSGALINVRGADQRDLAEKLDGLGNLAAMILSVEQTLTASGHVAAALPLAPEQPTYSAPAPGAPSPSAPVGYSPQPAPAPFPGASGGGFPQPQPQQQGGVSGVVCKHGRPAKYNPAGVSKRTGAPYKAAWVCDMPKDQSCGFWQNA